MTDQLAPAAEPLPDVGALFISAARSLHQVAAGFHEASPCRPLDSGFCQEHLSGPPCRNAMLRLALAQFPMEFFADGETLTEQTVELAPPPAEAKSDRFGVLGVEILTELKHLRAGLGVQAGVSSVELTVDSKGVVKPTVKVYDQDPDVASAKAQEIFDENVGKYTARASV